jgi:hypothetical protein
MRLMGCKKSCALVASAALLLAACSSTNMAGTYPKGGSVIPDTQLHLTPGYTLPLEKLIYWGAAAAVAYYVTDPLAPNWEISEAKFPGDHYRLFLHMKRYYTGGAGESRVVFNRRAKELMLSGGFDGYQILDYDEGLESSVLGSQRVAEGTIALTRSYQSGSNQGMPPPARSTTPRVENPRS